MPETTPGTPVAALADRRATWRELAAVWLLAWLAMAASLAAAGGWTRDLGGHPDEAAHFVTAGLARDYLLHGLGHNPIAYAEAFYARYPKVAIGNWPPVFYGVLGIWMALFGMGKVAVTAFMTSLAATLGSTVYGMLRPTFGGRQAGLAVALLLGLALVRQAAGMVMLELPVALGCLLAARAWGTWLDRPGWRPALHFGAIAGVTVLVKGSALSLALLPGLALLLSQRWHDLRRPTFWLPALVVVGIAGPWTWLTRSLAQEGWLAVQPGWDYTTSAVQFYLPALLASVGVMLPLALLGAVTQGAVTFGVGGRQRVAIDATAASGHGVWTALAALALAVPLFHLLVPAGREARHLVPMLPAVVALAVAGLAYLAAWIAAKSPGLAASPLYRAAVAGGVVLLFFSNLHLRMTDERVFGYEAIATLTTRRAPALGPQGLVIGDATSEGAFIAEIMRHPGSEPIQIHRSSKLLAHSAWSGIGYRLRADDPAAILALLDASGIGWIVEQCDYPDGDEPPHHVLFQETASRYPSRIIALVEVDSYRDQVAHHPGLRLYRFLQSPDPHNTPAP